MEILSEVLRVTDRSTAAMTQPSKSWSRVRALESNLLLTFFVKQGKGGRFQWLLSMEG